MGREVRRVPPHWEHPTEDGGRKLPMHDQSFADRFAEWLADFDRIRRGELEPWEREAYESDNPLAEWLLDDGTPIEPDDYRPWTDEEATWFQVWETVSEGTPITPPFATKEELVEHLVKHGDDWRRLDGNGGYDRATAEAFVEQGFASSGVLKISEDGTSEFATGIESVMLTKAGDR